MRYIDFVGQVLLLLATLILSFNLSGSGFLIGQFLIGVWQMTSSFISVLANAPLRKKKLIHLVLSICYLTFLYLLSADSHYTLKLGAVMIPAWVLAIYYFFITCGWTFKSTKRSKFLPNISF